MASDSRTTRARSVNVARKMHVFAQPGARVFILLSSGSLSCTQSIYAARRISTRARAGSAPSLYDAARSSEEVRRCRHGPRGWSATIQVQRQLHVAARCARAPGLSCYPREPAAGRGSRIYRWGEDNTGAIPIAASASTRRRSEAGVRAAVLDSTMRSNVTVGPPIDLCLRRGRVEVTRSAVHGDDPLVK